MQIDINGDGNDIDEIYHNEVEINLSYATAIYDTTIADYIRLQSFHPSYAKQHAYERFTAVADYLENSFQEEYERTGVCEGGPELDDISIVQIPRLSRDFREAYHR